MRQLLRIGAIAACLSAVPVMAQEEDGGGFLENLIESRLSSDGFQVDVQGFEGALSSRATVDAIIISDEDGAWLTVRDAVLDWNRTALLRGRLQVEELSADQVLLPRLPQGGEQQANVPSPEAQPFSLPDLPVSINIGQLAIARAEIGQSVFGEEAVMALQGSAQLADGEGQVDISAERIDDEQGVFSIAGSYANDDRRLAIDIGIEEGPDGIVANLADIPGRPSLSASIEGEGPLSDFTAEIALASDGEPRLDGTVSLSETDGANSFAADLSGDVTALFTPQYRPFFGPNVQLEAAGARFPDGRIELDTLNLQAQSLSLNGQVAIGADGVPDLIDVTGEITDDGPVLLPVGEEIRVGRVGLDVQFDASEGEEWTGEIVLEDLDQPGVQIDRVLLDGTGIISGSGEDLDVEGTFDVAARGISLEDGGLETALGNEITGEIVVDYSAGEPVRFTTLDVSGAGFDLDGSAQVDPDGENVPVGIEAAFAAEDLSLFSALAGRPLSGSIAADLDLSATLRDGGFDVLLNGTAQDLETGINDLDPLLTGETTLLLDAARDDTGTRITGLRLQNEALDIEGSADISSSGGTARVTAEIDDLSRLDQTLSGPASLSLTADRPADVWDVILRASGAEAEVTGNVTISDLEGDTSPLADGEIAVSAASLSNFSTFIGRELSGSVDLTANGSGRFDLSQFDLTSDGTLTDVSIDQPNVDPLLDGETDIALTASRDGDVIQVPRFRIQNPQVSAVAEASVEPGDSNISADIDLVDVSLILPDVSGDATVSLNAVEEGETWRVDLEGSGATADIDADVTITGLRDEGTPVADGTVSASIARLGAFSEIAGRELSGSASLEAEGRLGFDLMQADLSLDGTLNGIRIGQTELDRLLRGVTTIDVTASRDGETIRVPTFLIENPQITATGNADVAPGDSAVTMTVRLPDLSEVVSDMSGDAIVSLQANEDGEVWRVELEGSGASADIGADLDITGLRSDATPVAEGTVTASVARLAAFSQIAGRDLGGSAEFDARGNLAFDLAEANIALDGTLRDIAIGQTELDRLLRGTTDITVDGMRDGDVIRVSDFSIENPQIVVSASADVAEGDSDVTAEMVLRELSEIVPAMSGSAQLQLNAQESAENWNVVLDGSGAGADVAADLVLSDLRSAATAPSVSGTASIGVDSLSVFSSLAGRELGGSADVDAEGRVQLDFSDAALTLDGVLRDIELGQPELDRLLAGVTEIVGDVGRDGDAIAIRQLRIENPQVSLTGEGRYGPGQNAAQAALILPDLGQVVPALSGRGAVEIFAEEIGNVWQVVLDGEGPGVELDVSADVRNLRGPDTPVIDGEANVSVADLSRFQSLVNQQIAGSVQLSAEGSAAIDGSRFDMSADALAQNLATGIAQVDQLLGGRSAMELAASRVGPDAPIRVQTFRVDTTGLDATASGTLLGGDSDLQVRAQLANLGTFVNDLDGPVSLQGNVGQSGNDYTLDVSVTGPQGTNADISGTVGAGFDRANLSVDGAAPLRLANPFLEPRALSGTASFDLGVNGPLALSSLSGTVTIPDGRFIDPGLPFVLEGINATARIQNATVQLNATAQKQEGGSLSAQGQIGLTGNFPADISVALNQLVVEDPRLYRTTANGTITVNGPLTGGGTIGGTINLGETEIRVPNTGLGATGPIPDGLRHVGESAEVRTTLRRAGLLDGDSQESASNEGGNGGFALDLTIEAENRIFIRGRGLDAELGGSLTLRGTTSNVIPAGRFELIRGRLDILGQRILLTEGFVNLEGDFTPRIRLVAETEADDVLVRVIVEGAATEPEITFASTPELPEDEVLSRLLFGRSVENISPLQAAQLASAVATLAGRGGEGIVGRLRQQTGLDDLDITTDDEGNVGVRAGRYLSENVYTDVTVDAEGEAQINLNLDVTDSITARGSASNEGETSLGVFFERDY